MALPTFSKAGMTTLAFSRAYVFPITAPRRPRQHVGRSDSGTVRVLTLSPADVEYPLQFEAMTQTDHDTAVAWLAHTSINYAESTFTFTDVDGVAHTVRCLDFEFIETADGVFSLRFLLLQEPS